MNPTIVLDKSYLEGAKAEAIHSLCDGFSVLMIDTLFMELSTTSDKHFQAACFRKFPNRENPVELIEGTGSLLSYEIEKKRPATPLHDRRLPVRFTFNAKLTDGSFVFSDEQLREMNRWETQISDDSSMFKACAAVTDGWFPELKNYKPGQPTTDINRLRTAIASEPDLVRGIYDQIRNETFPAASLLTPEWALYRQVQVLFLFALEYVRRYGCNESNMESREIPQDVADSQYVICGALAGGLATRDKALRREFMLLCPDGRLIG